MVRHGILRSNGVPFSSSQSSIAHCPQLQWHGGLVEHHAERRTNSLPRTMTMRFRKPIKLGVASESWLKHDGRTLECTAATWRYFFCVEALSFSIVVPSWGSASTKSGAAVPLRRLLAFPLLARAAPFEASMLVAVAVLMMRPFSNQLADRGSDERRTVASSGVRNNAHSPR